MSEYAPFIQIQYLRDTMPLDSNVRDELLRMSIRDAQETYIRDLIGSGIYDAICDQINDTGILAPYIVLVNDYIAPALARYVLYEAADVLTFQITNKGFQTRNSEFSNSANINDITGMALRFKQRADFFAHKVTAFLLENQNDYPLYRNPGSGIDTIYPQESHLIAGFFFGNTTETDCYNNP